MSRESGLETGVWGSSVDLGASDGVVFDDLNTKLDAYVGYKREVVPGLTADVGLLYYYYPKDSNIATDYFEPSVSLSGSLGPVNATVGLNYPWGGQNALGTDDSIYAYSDLKPALPNPPFIMKGPYIQ